MSKYEIHEISDVELAFPAHAYSHMHGITEEPDDLDPLWPRFATQWFHRGLQGAKLVPRDGVDAAKAWRHLRAIIGSYEPKHEHKMAALAVLASDWFSSVTWDGMDVTP